MQARRAAALAAAVIALLLAILFSLAVGARAVPRPPSWTHS